MRLWTIQGIEIYKQIKSNGYAYCSNPSWGDEPCFMYAYRWMAQQMRQRIGEPPIKEIEYPIWAWYQYDSSKKRKPPRSTVNVPEGLSAYMEIEMPDNDVLLSDFDSWSSVLNQGPIDDWKRIYKTIDALEKEEGRYLQYGDYPQNIRDRIEKSWETIFDLNRRDDIVGKKHKRNRSIQATFWILKKEHIVSVECLKREDDLIRTFPSPLKRGDEI